MGFTFTHSVLSVPVKRVVLPRLYMFDVWYSMFILAQVFAEKVGTAVAGTLDQHATRNSVPKRTVETDRF